MIIRSAEADGSGGRSAQLHRLTQVYISLVNALVRDDRGASGVEYGIMLAAVAALIAAGAYLLGGKTQTNFTNLNAVLP